MRAALLSCVLVAGCGRIAFDARSDGDAGIGGDGAGDGGTADVPTACASANWSAWSAPVTQTIGPGTVHYLGSISDDGLTMMYASYNGANADDLYVVSRASLLSPWGSEQLLTELQTVDNDYNPITHDGLTVYFSSERGGAAADIFVTTRPNLGAQFSTPVAVAGGINKSGYDATGWISPDGLRMFYASDAITPDIDIYVSERPDTGSPFSAGTPIAALAGSGQDSHPVLTADEREIFWSSRRASSLYDVYHATRASRTDPFGSPTPVTELNTASDDGYSALSPDGTTMYLNWQFLTTSGNALVWMSTRTCQ